jgi:ribonuclease P protein component
MTAPKAMGQGNTADIPVAPALSCVLPALETLRQRSDFLRTASARRQATHGFLVQARHRGDDSALIRVGFTCSKKLGNAVARNRAKRRLREVARAILPLHGIPGWDYVLVGRPKVTAERGFADLLDDLTSAIARIHQYAPRT